MGIEQKRFKVGRDLCAYCGVNIATQREDPVPRGLYPKRARAQLQLLKNPACSDCNGAKTRVDNALRDFLVIDLDCSAHAVAQEVCAEKMASGVTGNHVRLIDDFYTGEDAPVFNREGNFDGTAYGRHPFIGTRLRA